LKRIAYTDRDNASVFTAYKVNESHLLSWNKAYLIGIYGRNKMKRCEFI